MLHASFFHDFKGAETLLLWGDNSDMAHLSAGLVAVRKGQHPIFAIEGGPGITALEIRPARGDWLSRLSGTYEALKWVCSPDVLDDCINLIEPLLTSSGGHQYVDTEGDLAEQVMIAVNEYPDHFRRR